MILKRTPTALLFTLICLCVMVRGQEQSPAPKSTNEPTSGTISGKVVNESGQPVAGATAFIRPLNALTAGRTISTDAEGSFRVNNLPPALYMVGATAPAYTSVPSDPNAPATYYRIGDSVNVQLVRGGVITGTVTNALGEPVVAIRVRVAMVRDATGRPSKMTSGSGFSEQSTDDRGVYRIYGLSPGTYIVSAGGYGYYAAFQFNPYDFDVPTYAPSATRDNAAEVTVRGGEEANVDIRYRGESGHSVSGTVKVAGTGGASVWLTPVAGSAMPVGNAYQAAGARGFAFHGVGDGEYELVARESITPPQTAKVPVMWASESKRITVKGASVSGVELVTKPLAAVSGRIVLEPSKVPECKGKRAPLFAETLVQLRRPEKDAEKESSPNVREFGGSASPDSKGEFVLRSLSPGRYQFDPRFYARYWYLQSITTSAAIPATTAKSQAAPSKVDAAANWTTMKSGDQLTNLTITLAEGAASIRGKLALAEPPSGMVLYLVPSEQDKATDVLRYFVTDIGADGTFALNNLPPGRYWSLTQATADAQTATLTKLRLPDTATTRSKLRRAAETQKTEIELKPCQNLTDYQLKQ
jgi:hypothetical protein